MTRLQPPSHARHRTATPATPAWPAWLTTLGLLGVAAALRFHRLDGQLWLDEISALRGYRKPFLETLTTFPEFFPNPLYELAAHASLLLFGESAFAIRLPAALFGVACVFVLLRLGRRCLGSGEALLAAALLSVSYHHVFYSQDARGYTAYLFFALWSTDLLVELLERARWRTALAYAATAALATYAHPFGVFVPLGQLAVALAWAWRRRGAQGAASPARVIATGLASGAAILLLYAPLLRAAVAYAFAEARAGSHGPRVHGLVPELLEGLRAGLGAWPALVLAAGIGLAGAADLLRRRPLVLLLLVAPLAVSALTVLVLGAGVHPRYFLLALPAGVLVGARGLARASALVLRPLSRRAPGRGAQLQAALALAVVLAAALPLLRYYALPKQDYLGALARVHGLAAPEDVVVAADLAGLAIRRHYDAELPMVEDLEDLLRVEASGRRVWVLTTLEHVLAQRAPELSRRLHGDYRRVAVLPGRVGDGALRIYVREAASPPSDPRSGDQRPAYQE